MVYKSWGRGAKADQKKKATPPPFRNGNGRQKCKAPLCGAMGDPSGTGYCSTHNMNALNVGATADLVEPRTCRECHGLCEPPKPGMDEPDMCQTCIEFARYGSGELDGERSWELGDEPVNHPSKRKSVEEDDSLIDAYRNMLLEKEHKYREMATKIKQPSRLAGRLTDR